MSAPPFGRIVIAVRADDPEEVGVVEQSTHPALQVSQRVRAVYFQRLEATGELDVYRLESESQWYAAYPDESDPLWARTRLVVHVIGPWPRNWDDGPAFNPSPG